MASLNAICPKCGCSSTPDKIRCVDFERVACPECRERFIPVEPRPGSLIRLFVFTLSHDQFLARRSLRL